MKEQIIWTILVLLPKNLVSQLFGWLAYREWPLFSQIFRDVFVNMYSIDMSEAELAQNEYPSVQKLFIRRLKEGARSIGSDEIVSPVDGKLSQFGSIIQPNLELIQAKGKTYSLEKLIGSKEVAQSFENGVWATIYLAPFNYHRIHSPVSGSIIETTYIPGNLWPVNDMSIARVPELFCVNERVITTIKGENGGTCLVVKVGATNVGRISLSYTDLIISNSLSPLAPQKAVHWQPSEPITIAKGDELGIFELGSTVVVVADKVYANNNPGLFEGTHEKAVLMGQNL
ncbi:MAG: archaetidylserine decarboxylase [Fibrobacterales bacterium]